MANTNIINAVFGSGICAVTTSAYRANYGMKLRFSGIELPTAFEVDFSNYDVMGRDSITMIGQNGEVQIPDDLWDSGLNIYAYVYLHPTDDSGVTVYTVTIPVLGRPNRTEETPTPHEQSVIEQAISALNDAVEATAADVETTTANAQAAAQSEANALSYANQASASAGAALASQDAAESASQSATESATNASESARNAAVSASQAAESATNAQESAEQAERSVQSISGDVERAESAAATATEKATEAASSASTASGKANEASASATAAAQSASSASTAAQNAASSAQSAESSATDAEQAKTDAQDAQAAAEQAAQSVSGLSAQIAQNTADIADLVQNKAGALIDTATGSIASFVPDATVPTVRGLTVDVEPVQDLHGYDAPWPSGGGVNKYPESQISGTTSQGVTITQNGDSYTLTGTASAYSQLISPETFSLAAGTYTLKEFNWAVGIYCQLRSVDGQTTYASTSGAESNTFTLESETTLKARLVINENVTTNRTIKIEVVSGSTAPAAYSPYSNICPISGWDSVEVQRTGVNVWDEEWEVGYINPTTGEATSANDRIRTKNFNPCLPNTSYYVKDPSSDNNVRIFYYDADKNFVSETGWKGNQTVTTPSNAYFFKFIMGASYGTTYNHDICINYPATDTAYHSGTNNTTYTIQLGQTVYGGTVDVTNGVLTVDRAMADMGTLGWNKHSRNLFYTYGLTAKPVSSSNVVSNLICSEYKTLSGDAVYSRNDGISMWSTSGNVAIYDSNKTGLTTNQFKTAMSGVQLCYELATPITIDLTPIEISVLTGQTNNVWADSGDVSVEYAADLKTYIDNKIAAAVAALS